MDVQDRHLPGSRWSAGAVDTVWARSWSRNAGRPDPAGLGSGDPQRRARAWAAWAAERLITVDTGLRRYVAVQLEGSFYDPGGTQLGVLPPHLEVPDRVLGTPDPGFPWRLAAAGNALRFPWWLYPEVTAVRRQVMVRSRGDVRPLAETLGGLRPMLVRELRRLTDITGRIWTEVASTLVADPGRVTSEVLRDIPAGEIAAVIGEPDGWVLSAEFDRKLRERSGVAAARRVGVWAVRAAREGCSVRFGVLTPRLTESSVFRDPLFDPDTESVPALLVRVIMLARLTGTTAGGGTDGGRWGVPGHFRGLPAVPGRKLPGASVEAVATFVLSNPDPQRAWAALGDWADRHGYTVPVDRSGFVDAHRRTLRAITRSEEPDRSDCDLLLPLVWTSEGGLVRVTWARNPGP